MKILLDECLPRPLKKLITGHEVDTVQEVGWSGKKNGELLQAMSQQYDVLVTADRNIVKQQSLPKAEVSCVILSAPSSRMEHLEPLVPRLLAALTTISAADWIEIR
jgi:predicted nuclease of predicted toxin-antitoxin system